MFALVPVEWWEGKEVPPRRNSMGINERVNVRGFSFWF